ncbi:MAG TPA: glycosyltransferase family 2 protein [bacterium]|nr:glycosyltransferase family 2 protein [bacterium]
MLSIVIPAYNEEAAIGDTIARINRVIESNGLQDAEVIVVDDCSTDRTAEIAKSAGAEVVRHPHNAGYGLSLKHGIMTARNDTIVILDADGTYRPESINDLLIEYTKGFDMVVGARTGEFYRESWFKAPLRSALKLLVEFTAGRTIPDINSGLRVFSKKEAMKYFDQLCNTFSFTTSLTLAYMQSSKFVSYIPIPYDKRIGKTKVRLFHDSLRTMQYIVESILYFNPIKLFLVLCAITMIISGASAAVTLVFEPVGAVYVLTAGFFVTMIMFGLGMAASIVQKTRK